MIHDEKQKEKAAANQFFRSLLKGVGLPTITYGLEGEGRPNTVSASSGINPVYSTTYNTAGQATDVTFGSTSGSGDPVDFGYDPNTGRMTQYKMTINGTATHGDPTWNANGTLGSLAITDPFNASDAQTCNYGYDDMARLASAHCGASIWQQDFTYDPFGNITKTVPTGSTGLSFTPGYNESNNHYTDGATYDADGNLTNDGTDHVYTWDSDGHPVTLDSETLLYDALGREVEVFKSGAYTEFVFGPTGKLALMNGQTQTKAFVALPGGTQVKYAGSTISTYRLPDWIGSFRVGSNPNRTYSWGVAFAPFGEMYAQSGGAAWSFTGEEGTADTVSDEYDFLARKLHSAQGRWVSPDPAGMDAADPTNPQSWNLYAYAINSPLTLLDPLGLETGNDCGGPCVPFAYSLGGGCYLQVNYTPQQDAVTGKAYDMPDFSMAGPCLMTQPWLTQTSSTPRFYTGTTRQTPAQAATTFCQNHGQLKFKLPFTRIPVTISLSATLGPANYSSTNDASATIPLPVAPLANWLQAGASVDVTVNAPSDPAALLLVGIGRNLSAGRFVSSTSSTGTQGFSLSLGPSVGTPVNIAVPTGNACGWKNQSVK